jgi:hypothetical protein
MKIRKEKIEGNYFWNVCTLDDIISYRAPKKTPFKLKFFILDVFLKTVFELKK